MPIQKQKPYEGKHKQIKQISLSGISHGHLTKHNA